MIMAPVEESKGKSKKFLMRLLLTLARNGDLRKLKIAVPGIRVENIIELAEVLFPHKTYVVYSNVSIAHDLGPHILRQHPNLGKISLKGITSENYQRFVDRAINKFGLGKLEIQPVRK